MHSRTTGLLVRGCGDLDNDILRGAIALCPPPLDLLLLDHKEGATTLVMGMAAPVGLRDNGLARARGRAQEAGAGLKLPGRK